eukprot:COSAG01_NODE_7975_length_2968_cov_1.410945_3_plen_39_part_00
MHDQYCTYYYLGTGSSTSSTLPQYANSAYELYAEFGIN